MNNIVEALRGKYLTDLGCNALLNGDYIEVHLPQLEQIVAIIYGNQSNKGNITMAKTQLLIENLKPGEIYAGLILGKDGQSDYHLVLLEEKPTDKLNWDAAKAWAVSVGGELPTLREQSLLLANCAEAFEPHYYWSGEQDARLPNWVWMQDFDDGNRDNDHKNYEHRVRAVRKIPISE